MLHDADIQQEGKHDAIVLHESITLRELRYGKYGYEHLINDGEFALQ